MITAKKALKLVKDYSLNYVSQTTEVLQNINLNIELAAMLGRYYLQYVVKNKLTDAQRASIVKNLKDRGFTAAWFTQEVNKNKIENFISISW